MSDSRVKVDDPFKSLLTNQIKDYLYKECVKKEEIYSLCDSGGHAFRDYRISINDYNLGILVNKIDREESFFGFLKKEKKTFVGVIHFGDSLKRKMCKEWDICVYGREYLPFWQTIAEEMAEKFNKDITLILESEEAYGEDRYDGLFDSRRLDLRWWGDGESRVKKLDFDD